jgi:hypothetical protein
MQKYTKNYEIFTTNYLRLILSQIASCMKYKIGLAKKSTAATHDETFKSLEIIKVPLKDSALPKIR